MPPKQTPNNLNSQLPGNPGNRIPLTLIDCVKAYAAAGYATFPTTSEKVPVKGCKWTKATVDTDPSPLKYPYGQFGVKLKADDLIIDLDERNMKGRKIWTELKTKVSTLQEVEKTATIVQTYHNGLHIYLRKSPNFDIDRKSVV